MRRSLIPTRKKAKYRILLSIHILVVDQLATMQYTLMNIGNERLAPLLVFPAERSVLRNTKQFGERLQFRRGGFRSPDRPKKDIHR